MATTSPPVGVSTKIDLKIRSIKDVLSRNISESDRESLKKMLSEALDEKKKLLESQLKSLQAKYGLDQQNTEEVIVVEQSPTTSVYTKVTPRVSIKDPPGKYTKEAMGSLKRRRKKSEEEDPDFVITPPPARKKMSLPKKKAKVIVVEPSDASSENEEEAEEHIKTPAKKGKGKGTSKSVTRKATQPANFPDEYGADSPPPSPKVSKSKSKVTPKKTTPKQTAGKRRDNPWCSSSEDEGGESGVAYTMEEMNTIYDTMESEDPDIVTGKTGRLTRPEKNARLKALFKKVKTNVNAVGGNRRRKKYLWIKVTDHKSKTILRKKELVKKYGFSGAEGMPENEGLTQIQMRCLNFHGIECAEWAKKNDLDGASQDDEEDIGSGADEEAFEEAEVEQARLIEEYKESRRNTAQAKKEHTLADLQKKYKLEAVKAEVKCPEATKEEKAKAKGRRPARSVKAKKEMAVSDTDPEASPASVQTPQGSVPSESEPDSTKRRSSERLAKRRAPAATTEARSSTTSSRALHFQTAEDEDSDLPEGLADYTESSQMCEFDEPGDMNYSVHVRSQDEPEEVPTTREARHTSTPRESSADVTGMEMDKLVVVKISPLGNEDDKDILPSPSPSTTEPTKRNVSQEKKTTVHVASASSKPSTAPRSHSRPGPSTSSDRGESSTTGRTAEEEAPAHTSERRARTHAEFIDMRIQDTVSAGFQVIKSDWQRQENKFDSVEEQVVSMRLDVQKNNNIPHEVRQLRHQVELVQSSMSVLNNQIKEIKSDLSCIQEDGNHTKSDVQCTKSTVVGLKEDTSNIKGDTHTLKSKLVANTVTTVAVQSQVNNVLEAELNIQHELKTLKTDVVLLHGNLITIKSDVASVKNDMLALKAQMSSIAGGVELLTRSVLGREIGEITPAVEVDVTVKSDSDEHRGPSPPVPSTSKAAVGLTTTQEPQAHDSGVSPQDNESELNTSEVTFKQQEIVTYERSSKTKEPSPPRAKRKCQTSLFNLSDASVNLQLDSQETQDPNCYVADTEYTQFTQGSPSQTLEWPHGKDLEGTVYEGQSSSSVATKEKQYLSVINPSEGQGPENPQGLVPVHLVKDLDTRMSHPRESKSKSTTKQGREGRKK